MFVIRIVSISVFLIKCIFISPADLPPASTLAAAPGPDLPHRLQRHHPRHRRGETQLHPQAPQADLQSEVLEYLSLNCGFLHCRQSQQILRILGRGCQQGEISGCTRTHCFQNPKRRVIPSVVMTEFSII